jgi:hypothetical protein
MRLFFFPLESGFSAVRVFWISRASTPPTQFFLLLELCLSSFLPDPFSTWKPTAHALLVQQNLSLYLWGRESLV